MQTQYVWAQPKHIKQIHRCTLHTMLMSSHVPAICVGEAGGWENAMRAVVVFRYIANFWDAPYIQRHRAHV